jgi:hypothetical protein
MEDFPDLAAEVHWDDCCMDERSFWFHFHVDGLTKWSTQHRKRIQNQVRKAITRAKNRVRDHVDKNTPYQASWYLWDSPVAEYHRFGRARKVFHRYTSRTWIYKLTFYG